MFFCSKGNQIHRPKSPRQGGEHPQKLRPYQKTARYIEHPETEKSNLPESKIYSIQNNSLNFETPVFNEFFEWSAAIWVMTFQ